MRNVLVAVLRNQWGMDSVVGSLITLGAVIVLGGAIFVFAKGAGSTWLNGVLNSVTQYTP